MNPTAEKRGIYHGPGEVIDGVFVEHRNGDIANNSFIGDIKVTVYRAGIKQEARLITNVSTKKPLEEQLQGKPIALSFYNGGYIGAAYFKQHGILEIRHEKTGTIFYENWEILGKSDFANL